MNGCTLCVFHGNGYWLWVIDYWLLNWFEVRDLICALDTNLSLFTLHFSLPMAVAARACSLSSSEATERNFSLFTFHYSLPNVSQESFEYLLWEVRKYSFACCEASEADVGGIRMTRPRHCDEWLYSLCVSW